MQQKVRVNDLARELEVKSKAVLDYLPEIGVTEKKTHSSSLEPDEAEKVRQHFQGGKTRAAKDGRGARPAADEIRPKIDLSKISKPGDVLKAIQQKQAEKAAPPAPARPAAPPAAKPAALSRRTRASGRSTAADRVR